MTRDRTLALRAEATEAVTGNDVDVENGEAVSWKKAAPTFMDGFFQEVEVIRSTIANIALKVSDVKKAHSAILNSTLTEDTDKMKKDLEMLMTGITSSSHSVRSKLKDIEKQIKLDEDSHFTSADLRIRKAQHGMLSRKFIDVMTEYNNHQVQFRDLCKDRIQRQLTITNNKAVTDAEIEDMLEAGDLSDFTQGIIVQTQQTKQLLKDIEDRHEDILRLEKSLREVHDMFVDISILVEQQGEMIESIEYNIDQTQNYIGSAIEETHKALTYRKSARKKKICIIVCVAITVVILILVIALSIALS